MNRILKNKLLQFRFRDLCALLRLKNRCLFAAVFLLSGIAQGATPVQIDFFYEPGCHDCEQIETEILPEIGKRFGDACVIQSHDIGIETNFLTLLQLENELGHAGPDRAYLIVGKKYIFGPSPDSEDLFAALSELVGREPRSRQDSAITDRRCTISGSTLIEERYNGFTLPAVLLAGLLDGINPCAISTLVFFMSFLAVSKVRKHQLILLGISFCTASFLTYLALGFGLFRVLHLFSGYALLRRVVEWGMIAVLLVLAALSFRDAVRFRKSRDGRDVTLQLSTGMKKRIHNIMRRGLKTGHLVFGGLFIGTWVTALESVCTGQVYVPTLVLILKNNELAETRAWLYLVAYNLLFILPLILTFIAVYFGLRTETLLRWSGKNVILSKTLLATFFLLMAFLIFRV